MGKDPKIEVLKAHCAALNLCIASVEKVIATAKELGHFEKQKKLLKTLPQRSKELDSLKKNAKALCNTLQTMDPYTRLELQWELHGQGSFPGELLQFDMSVAARPSENWDVAILQLLKSVVEGVNAASEKIAGAGQKGGPRSLLSTYAIFISNMALVVCVKDKITPGRGGDFEKLCNWVFEAAGVHAKPEGAIRQFMKMNGREMSRLMRSPTQQLTLDSTGKNRA